MDPFQRAHASFRHRSSVWFARVLPGLLLLQGCTIATRPAALGAGEPNAATALGAAAERMAEDVRWLADDAQGGRRAGTPDEARVAAWLAERFSSLGLEPGGVQNYLQAFEVTLGPRDGGASKLAVRGGAEYGRGALTPLFCSGSGFAEGQLAWGGFAITRPEMGYDDLVNVSKTNAFDGRIALIVRGAPAGVDVAAKSDPSGDEKALARRSSGWGGTDGLFSKVMSAKRAGAKGVLIAPHPSSADSTGPLPAFEATRVGQAGIPALFITLDVARALEPAYDAMVRGLESPARSPLAFAPIKAPFVRAESDVVRDKGQAHNVLGLLRGFDSGRCVVVGAHYDHLGRGGEGSLAPAGADLVHNGADDNASGTALVLELARRLSRGPKPACDVLFALWSGEELGLLGSEHWAKHPTVALESVLTNLNFDMVGRADSGKLALLGAGTAEPFGPWIDALTNSSDLAVSVQRSGAGIGGSDHQTFLKRGIPALHFFTGLHADYHRPSDDFERFEAVGAARVAALAEQLLARCVSLSARPEFVKVAEKATSVRQGAGWTVRFGSMPDYGFDGPGVLLAGVALDSPAERAGLQQGDVLCEWAMEKIERVEDLMFALQNSKPGDVVLVRWRRGDRLQEARVTLEARELP